jgi:methanogenic corrinoid protein MtbC1
MSESSAAGVERLRTALGKARTELSPQDRWRTALVMALYAGNLEEAEHVILEARRELLLVNALDEIVAPAMRDIGTLWQRDEITIADEHLATFVAYRLLAGVAAELRTAAPGSRDTVLLATPQPERHAVGLMMVYDLLRGAGYTTVCLGAGVPRSSLIAALERHRPALVGLSATMAFPAELEETIESVFAVLPAVQVVIGGAAAEILPPRACVHLVPLLTDLLDAVDVALRGKREP